MTQLELVTYAPPKRRPTIEQRFASFHALNPHVMAEMLRLARKHLDRGERRIGAKALWEELRQSIRVCKLGEWQLDNSLTALYARALIEAEPRLVGVIETRRRKS
jgi:hypothetical protein